MLIHALRGSLVAFALCFLSLVCLTLIHLMVPPIYFALALGVWAVYSAYRLLESFRSGTNDSNATRDRAALAYWSGALASSLVAPLIWVLMVGLFSSTVRTLP